VVKSFYILTLGCAKNEVISEKFSSNLLKAGLKNESDASKADYIIINTCGFIEDAVEESIEESLKAVKIKKKNGKVILTGCLAQIYKEELKKQLLEVDEILDYSSFYDYFAAQSIDSSFTRYEDTFSRNYNQDLKYRNWDYLLISEGCSKNCTYCTIPIIKGDYRSFQEDKLIDEAKSIFKSNKDEIILISQDTALYGNDIINGSNKKIKRAISIEPLKRLISRLHDIGFKRIRILYFNLDSLPQNTCINMIKELYNMPKVLPYFEMPVQHLVDSILTRMGRQLDFASITNIFNEIKQNFPDSIIRTSLITGFPGESEEDFLLMKKRLENLPIDYLSVFAYSDMEKAPSFLFKDKVERQVAVERRNELLENFEQTLPVKFERFLDQKYECVIEDESEDAYFARFWAQTPQLDGTIIIPKDDLNLKIKYNGSLSIGDNITVKLVDSILYDFLGEIE
jgi:ribosomal protein S12 methylthiotransferase